MTASIVLSHFQTSILLDARRKGDTRTIVSPDLNRTTMSVELSDEGALFPTGIVASWSAIEVITDSRNACFKLTSEGIQAIQTFSEVTQWPRSLYPTDEAPTTLVAGLTMHRIVGIGPYQDTRRKIKAAGPLTGQVLDTATGLGYTAIEAARTANLVTTVELDPAGLEIARENPWSDDLFQNPRIKQIVGDVWEAIEEMGEGEFSSIIHDPPAFNLAGDLYSKEFYLELHRVLARRGRLFHYVGDPESHSGSKVTRGVIRRLQAAGFSRVRQEHQAFGVVAIK